LRGRFPTFLDEFIGAAPVVAFSRSHFTKTDRLPVLGRMARGALLMTINSDDQPGQANQTSKPNNQTPNKSPGKKSG
jgi:hypothetical protein